MRSEKIARAGLAIEMAGGFALGVAIAVMAGGDVHLALGGMVLRARSASRAIAIGLVAIVARFVVLARAGALRQDASAYAAYRMTVAAVLSSALLLVLAHRVASCGGLDSAGYLGAARLFLDGRLTELEPVARVLPFPESSAASAPLGFVASAMPFHIAPRFPPGLPLVMAAALAFGGNPAAFLVSPGLAVGCVLLVYLITRRSHGTPAASLAAVFTAVSPIFLTMAIQPMSDVPATFWVLLTAFLLWRSPMRPVAAGVAASMAVLTRPPLVLVCVALAMTIGRREWRRAARFVLVTGAGLAVLLLFQRHMYGDPFTSGYGATRDLFALSAAGVNLANHATWLFTLHTPLLFVLFALGWWYEPRLGRRALAVFLATAVPYLLYAPVFEDWEILRFLLPGLPFLFIVCACGVMRGLESALGTPRSRLAASALALGAAAASYSFLSHQHVFERREQEAKYPLVGQWIAEHTPANAVILGSLHTGSIHYYSGRATLRSDVLREGHLADVLGALHRAGYDAYLAVEQGDELESFQQRFHADEIQGLEIQPQARVRGVYIARLTMRSAPSADRRSMH